MREGPGVPGRHSTTYGSWIGAVAVVWAAGVGVDVSIVAGCRVVGGGVDGLSAFVEVDGAEEELGEVLLVCAGGFGSLSLEHAVRARSGTARVAVSALQSFMLLFLSGCGGVV